MAGLIAFALASCRTSPVASDTPLDLRPLPGVSIENARRITGRIWAGGQPADAAAFQKLAALGVKTVISVDGAKPDVEAARSAGLRYIHLPIGYDGVPEGRALELARALRSFEGPVYIHCHHGLHRGPAAAAVGCIGAGLIDRDQGLEVLRVMGTGPEYLGLWASVRNSRPLDVSVLGAAKTPFQECVPVQPLVDSMVSLDAAIDHLQACARAGWKSPARHPDLDPAQEALGAKELMAELLRTPEVAGRPEGFRRGMEAAHQAALDLETLLRAVGPQGAKDSASLDRSLAGLKSACADCHKRYRNVAEKRP